MICHRCSASVRQRGGDASIGVVPAAGRRTPPQPVRAIVSDLDGTLLRSDGTLSSATITTLRATRRFGGPFIVATSRTPRAVRRIAGHQVLGTVVCANGAIVWATERDEILDQTRFEPSALIAAVGRLARQVPDAAIALLSADTIFLDERYLAQRSKKGLADAVLAPNFGQVVNEHAVAAVSVRHPSLVAEQLLVPVSAAFAGTGEATFAGMTAVDVVPTGATKSAAVDRLLTDAGHHGESAVVFGDMPNDLGLFACLGWSCAVANSHPLVLQAADEIVPATTTMAWHVPSGDSCQGDAATPRPTCPRSTDARPCPAREASICCGPRRRHRRVIERVRSLHATRAVTSAGRHVRCRRAW